VAALTPIGYIRTLEIHNCVWYQHDIKSLSSRFEKSLNCTLLTAKHHIHQDKPVEKSNCNIMAPPTLLDLPDELLLQLPEHMCNVEDFMNASSSCTRLRNTFANTLPKTLLHLASQSAPTFFSPHPDFLVLSVARQLGTWAVALDAEKETRSERLVQAFRGGMPGILELALDDDVEGVGLSMTNVRRMYEARFRVINPLNQTINAMIGSEWYAQPDFWDGGADDAFTLDADVDGATMQLLIYGELFGPTMEAFLRPADKLHALGAVERIEFVKYCIPDWVCRPTHDRTDGFDVLPVGPFKKYEEGIEDRSAACEGNQTALAHLLGGAMFQGALWKRAWRRVLIAAGVLENEDGAWPEAWQEKIRKLECQREDDSEEPEVTSNVGYGVSSEEVETGVDGVTGNGITNNGRANEEEDRGERADAESIAVSWQEVVDEKDESEEDEEDENDQNDQGDQAESNDNWDTTRLPPDEKSEDWRFTLFWNTLTKVGGLQTMEMVAQFKGREKGREVIMKPEWKATIVQIRDQVLALKDEDMPTSTKYGRRRKLEVSHAPDFGAELYWCCVGLWCGL
jgi:hypothetical protein